MEKIILYYKFVPIPDTESVMHWQRALCASLGLKGRILISGKGLNGTLGGDLKALKAYKKAMNEHSLFGGIEYKWSDGRADDFPKLSVKVRSETVTLGWEPTVTEQGVIGGGKHLKPEKVHELVEQYGDDVVFFDGRNKYEASIGKFKNAVVPNTNTSRDFIAELESDKYDDIKDKKVITYCTGGIRCEAISAMMKKRGFSDVYQIDGGIVKYGEAYGDDGLWEGSLRVFDDRMTVNFSDHTKTIGECSHCKGKTSNFENCALAECNDLVLICEDCKQNPDLLFHTANCKSEHEAKIGAAA